MTIRAHRNLMALKEFSPISCEEGIPRLLRVEFIQHRFSIIYYYAIIVKYGIYPAFEITSNEYTD